MLSDRDSLLAAIHSHPDEDTPRLMFADYLDEQGDADRAEFIRLQCEFARLAEAGDGQAFYEFLVDRDYITRPAADWSKIDAGIARRLAIDARTDALLKSHAGEWTPRPPRGSGVRWEEFRRGFPHRLVLEDAAKAVKHADRLRASAPAFTLVANEFTASVVERLADAGLLDRIAGLELGGDGVAAGLRALGHHPEAAGVRTLAVHGERDAVASALADSPHWTGLRALTLSGYDMSLTAAETLFLAPNLRSIHRLALTGLSVEPALRVLSTGGGRELVSFVLTGCDLDDDAAELLAACPDLATLRALDLGHNRLTGRGVTALLCSPHLKNVAFLGLESNPGEGLDAERMTAAEPGGLRMIHAHGCRFGTTDVRALARCPRLRTLWYLDLDANGFGSAAVHALIRGFRDFCPPILWMTHNQIDDRGIEALSRWKAAAGLRVLHLRYNNTTDAAARALLDSPHLANLDDLGVSGVTDETAARLKARFKHFGTGYP